MRCASRLFRAPVRVPARGTLLAACAALPLLADGPKDNLPDQVRPVPPPGLVVPEAKASILREGLGALGASLESLRRSEAHREVIEAYLADVEICHRAVRDALQHGEFFKENEIDFASTLLETGKQRAAALARGETPWTRETGFVIRAYRSRIDGSAQPYGLEIPAHYRFDDARPWRLDCWFHGRGETLGEVAFLQQRAKGQGGKISPPDGIVLHPYGRYSNANKFAGEVDLFEALGHAGRDYRIDPDRVLVRGFSMGGAACWQFAVHFPGKWAAAQPGAGFSETPDFLRTFQGETLNAPWWEEKLWRCYDATHWAVNLSNYPVIAYSGELDRQKQAADQMVAAAEREDLARNRIPARRHRTGGTDSRSRNGPVRDPHAPLRLGLLDPSRASHRTLGAGPDRGFPENAGSFRGDDFRNRRVFRPFRGGGMSARSARRSDRGDRRSGTPLAAGLVRPIVGGSFRP
jgi:pimeloyl-ACP methyl ester carboxylesterase